MSWVRDGLVAALQLLIDAIGAAGSAVVGAWPINMPALPSAPEQFGTVFAWIRWSPLPIDAGFAFILFALSVWLAWFLVAPVLRWAKVID